MRIPLSIVLVLALQVACSARTLHVGTGRPYADLNAAAAAVLPGDTVLVHAGIYAGGIFLSELHGRNDAWITLAAVPGETVLFRGGGEALHLSDVSYLRLAGFAFEGQTGNGVNIDDGGSYETPSHHVLVEDCEFRALAATGNNDQLKLSGVDSFSVRRCRFLNGSAGGSGVDMVGCHDGNFENNTFRNGGSNCIQAKGGSRRIRIERNGFFSGGQRAINIGGSTGAQFFRPVGAPYEAMEISVYANVFTGSQTPFAFVGAVNCGVINNTICYPEKWVFRILQETVGAAYLPCGGNTVRNNIFLIRNAASNPAVNIGPNTDPASFMFANNLWFNSETPAWNGPNLPAPETGSILRRDPLLADPANEVFTLPPASPAIGAGIAVPDPLLDYRGTPFASPRSIGAIEGAATSLVSPFGGAVEGLAVSVFPNPARRSLSMRLRVENDCLIRACLHDMTGRLLGTLFEQDVPAGVHHCALPLPASVQNCSGAMFLRVSTPVSSRVILLTVY
jgi:hypothetical protein